ncbi:MAG: metal ABC transporter ATP-binding protein [Desulfovibrio sp.]|jgi:zinc transport system ATP-binding protein|nr:metal ABC transporter ATP-binding protein [Desulfovibrio sp.]
MSDRVPCAIVFDRLCVTLGGRRILDDVCIEIPAGGATVLVGPNGAGKTTLLQCLVGKVPHTGRITMPKRLDVGYVPQTLEVARGLPLRVAEFLALGLQRRPLWLGVAERLRGRILETLALVQAESLVDAFLCDLSGGELRRVLLAQALARDPQLLLLDEPDAGVDVQGERRFWEILTSLRLARGFTQVMVTHNLPLAAHYATNVICLDGRVLAQGPPRQTLTAPMLFTLFGVPIHLYPDQCETADPPCPECGALAAGHEAPTLLPLACPKRWAVGDLSPTPPTEPCATRPAAAQEAS